MQLAVFRLWQLQLFNRKTFLFCTFFKFSLQHLLCSESFPLFNSPLHWQRQNTIAKTELVHASLRMWRQTQEWMRRGVMSILHCILLVLLTDCFSTLTFLMRTTCWIKGEAASDLHLRHTDHRPLLLLFPSHSVQLSWRTCWRGLALQPRAVYFPVCLSPDWTFFVRNVWNPDLKS